jgi:hypothetical protein
MHYSDGTAALVGDIVRGKGYNIPYEIVGPVNQLLPGNGKTCNIRVLTIKSRWEDGNDGDYGRSVQPKRVFEQYEEAGTCAEFTLVARQGWSRVRSDVMVWRADSDTLPAQS